MICDSSKSELLPYSMIFHVLYKIIAMNQPNALLYIMFQCTRRMQFGKSILRCQSMYIHTWTIMDICTTTPKFGVSLADCKTQCHPECREASLLPCIARGTPSKHQRCTLTDFVPQTSPMIPHVLIHCINEIERRGLDSVGIYRVPGYVYWIFYILPM